MKKTILRSTILAIIVLGTLTYIFYDSHGQTVRHSYRSNEPVGLTPNSPIRKDANRSISTTNLRSLEELIKILAIDPNHLQQNKTDVDESQNVDNSRLHCNPPSMQVGEEGNVDETKYKLKQVHLIIRHGDRTPMGRLPGNIQPIRINCRTKPSEFTKEIGEYVTKFKEAVKNYTKKGNIRYYLYPNQELCSEAVLTGVGAVQHLLNGIKLRNVYIGRHSLLPTNWNSSHVSLLTTVYSRTHQSAVALTYGILDTIDDIKGKISFSSNPLFCTKKMAIFTGVSCSCKGIKHFSKLGNKMLSNKKQNSRLRRNMTAEIADLAKVDAKSVPWVGTILDALSSYECHNIPLPCYEKGERCYTKDLVNRMWQLRDEVHVQPDVRNQYHQIASRLQLHPLMTNIRKQMEGSDLKFALYSGHDTIITPTAISLGFGLKSHPPYASKIVFEMYQRREEPRENLLKFLYNGKDVTKRVVFCVDRLNEDGLCPLTFLKQYTETTDTYYEDMCNWSENESR